MDKKYTILIIDDKVENLKYLNTILEPIYDVRASKDSTLAISAAKLFLPDLILLDIKMPDIDGFELCKIIKKEKSLKDIPIIFISAVDELEYKIKAFDNGGVDYITKPFESKEVIARVKTQLDLANNKKMVEKLLHQQDVFVKKIMHEMNTPVSIISLNTQALERELGPKNEFNSIKASVKTLSSIYGDLEYMIKKESRIYTKKDINIVNFLSSRIVFFDEMASLKNITIDLLVNDEFCIYINEEELIRILDNNISNAIKYSSSNSKIIIEIVIKNNKYLLSIKDEGCGIDLDSEIFTPFYQQSTSNIGLGLGLSIVKEICDKHKITIDIKSKQNEGSEFIYDLSPLVKKDK